MRTRTIELPTSVPRVLMTHPTRYPWIAYAVAVLTVAVAASLSWLLGFVLNPSFYGFFYISVMLSAWYGGLRAGGLAIILSVVLIAGFLMPPHWGLGLDAVGMARVVLFTVVAVLICGLSHQRDQARGAEIRLRRRFEVTLDSIADAVIATSPDGRIVYLNGIAEELTGWSRDEAAGRPLAEVFRIVDERTRAPVEDPIAKVFRTGATAGPAGHTLLVARDDRAVPIDDSVAPIRDAGNHVLGVVLVFRDVSARRRAEDDLRVSRERLDLVLASSRVGLWYSDLPFETHSLIWNERCKEHHGLGPEATVTIDVFYDRLHPDDRARARAVIERSIAERCDYDIEYRTVAPDGRIRWIHALGRAFSDPTGRLARFDGITVDVTERTRAERELLAAKEKAEEASRSKDQFLAVLSHELRTPLTPVLVTVTAWLDEPDIPDEIRQGLELIRRGVELESRLIDDLLDMTRIVHGKLPLDRTVVDVHALLHQTIGICRSDLQGKRSRLELDLAAIEFHVLADAARLQQVFWNLIKNAVKFSAEGGRLAIRSWNQPGPDGSDRPTLVIALDDSGIGIDPEILPRIFDVFEQGEAGMNRRHGGLGLGLAISRSIAEAHGGTLIADSPGKGQGATFTLALETIPSRPPGPDDPDPDPNATNVARTLRILLVEDDQTTRRVMARLLQQRGFEVATAASLADALHASESYPFDLLISDIGLPDGTGLDLIRSLRARRLVKAIALSGFGMDSDIARSRAAGFDAHLTKPVNFNSLETTIRRVASDDTGPGE